MSLPIYELHTNVIIFYINASAQVNWSQMIFLTKNVLKNSIS